MQRFDVAILGGGPAGLALAAALSGSGLSVAVVERQPAAVLEHAPFDGREIALTHHSRGILSRLGAWALFPDEEVSPMREARVLNGTSPYALRFDPRGRDATDLGWLVPNHRIRRALFRVASGNPRMTLIAGTGAAALDTDVEGVRLRLEDGRELRAGLLAVADGRASRARDWLGIGAETLDFEKRMMVVRVGHERPHGHVATEWFGYGQTIAMLPLTGDRSSAVVTLPPAEMAALEALSDAELGPEVARRYGHRLGAMEVLSSRHVYPLSAVYAERFHATRAALIGDTAVGMHPTTAHGFNFGLRGADLLAREVRDAAGRGRDFGAPDVLRRYAVGHRRATRGLFLATNAITTVFNTAAPPVRLLRDAALRVANGLAPVRRAVVSHLMEQPGRA